MTEDLLQDLVLYKKSHEKAISTAARSLITLFREVDLSLSLFVCMLICMCLCTGKCMFVCALTCICLCTFMHLFVHFHAFVCAHAYVDMIKLGRLTISFTF